MDDLEVQLKRAVDECERLREELATTQSGKSAAEKKHTVILNKLNKVLHQYNISWSYSPYVSYNSDSNRAQKLHTIPRDAAR